jgi:hypothetical protein
MNQPKSLFSKPRLLRALLFFVSGALAATMHPVIAATDSASINARVVDAANGQFLRGAVVQVEGTTLQAVSDLQGAVVLSGGPPGISRCSCLISARLPCINRWRSLRASSHR